MSERVWTPSQKDAIEADTGSLLVSAAAGSGKTAVLVERIVRLLTKVEPPVAPSELLVVTFTNAAAAEMRSRIYTAISGLMRGSNGEKRAQLAAILPRLDEMNVCTMDAFGIKLVRENFHACGVQSDFTILDNGESDILKKETAADTVESVFAEFPESSFRKAERTTSSLKPSPISPIFRCPSLIPMGGSTALPRILPKTRPMRVCGER